MNLMIGVYLPISYPRGLQPPQDLLEYAREAEAAGFDSLWVGDHLLWHVPILEPTTTLAAVASVTRRVSLGINVYLLALRPVVLSAKVLGNLWYLTNGRLVLGVGVGGDLPAEFDAAGIPVRERGQRLDRALQELYAWWGGAGCSDSRRGYVAPAPGPELPLWVGGRSEAALHRALRHRASVWSAHFMTPEQLRDRVSRLAELSFEAGVPKPGVALTLFVHVTGGVDDAREFVEAHFGAPFDRFERFVVRGSQAACVERLRAYAGSVDHLLLFPATFSPRRQLAELAGLVEELRRDWRQR